MTGPNAAEASFGAGLCRAMKKAGIRGRPAPVWMEGEALRIAGARAGGMIVPLERIERVRIGFYEGKYGKAYRSSVWVAGEPRPIEIQPMKPYRGYCAVMRRLAAEVARRRGIGAVERGIERGLAVFNFAVLAGGFLALVLAFALGGDPSQWPLLLLAIVFAGLALYAWREMRRKHLPRPVTSLDALAVQLPEAE